MIIDERMLRATDVAKIIRDAAPEGLGPATFVGIRISMKSWIGGPR